MPAAIGRIKFNSTGFRFQPTCTLDGRALDIVDGGATPGGCSVVFRQQGQPSLVRTGNGTFTITQVGSGAGATNVGGVTYNPTWGVGNDIPAPGDYEAEFTVTLVSGPNAGLTIFDNIHFGVDPALAVGI